MHPFRCDRCGQTVHFENTRCERCGSLLGYLPGSDRMCAFDPAAATGLRWQPAGDGAPLAPCANRVEHAVCNWMLDEGDLHALCRSCRLTSVIPDLTVEGHLQRWAKIEAAKRRLVVTLNGLGLAPEPKTGPDDTLGLSFELLADVPDGPPVLTGHAEGVITLNIAEADDVHREAVRVRFNEPVRTLLGHLRHEASHYLQHRWIDATPAIDACRAVFGDERDDYTAALARHHAEGPPADWSERFISAYASAHPWEDWAETCAHVLLVTDAVQTAGAWGLRLDGPAAVARPGRGNPGERSIDELVLDQWLPVAQFLNAMNRSIGLPDSYPFLIPDPVLQKMATVQHLLRSAARRPGERRRDPPAKSPARQRLQRRSVLAAIATRSRGASDR